MPNCIYPNVPKNPLKDFPQPITCTKVATHRVDIKAGAVDPYYCEEHFAEQWWVGRLVSLTGDDRKWPNADPRVITEPDWKFSLIAFVDELDFELKSGLHMAEKIGRNVMTSVFNKDYANIPIEHNAPVGTQGHSWIRLAQGKKYWSFGATDEGLTCPDSYEDAENQKHIKDDQIFALDVKISREQMVSICQVVTKWVKNTYDATDKNKRYHFFNANCTTFVMEACEAAKIPYPAVPRPAWSNNTGLLLTQTPAGLFNGLSDKEARYNPKGRKFGDRIMQY